MPRTERNRMSLNTVGFQPTVFNALEYKPVEVDYTPLARSFAMQEERKQKSMEQTSAVKTALGKARESLHKDEETLAWFDKKAKDIENKLNAAAEVGDYAGAINLGIQQAGELATDAELNGRIRTNAEYESKKQRLQDLARAGKIKQETVNYYLEQNPYSFKPIKDSEGNIIGAEEWDFAEQPVDDLDVGNLFLTAFRMITPTKTNSARDNYSTNVNKDKTPSNITTTSQKSTESVSEDDILKQALNLLYADSDWEAKIKQMYNVAFSKYEKNKARLDELLANGDNSSPEYQMLQTLVNQEEQMFFTEGSENDRNQNTFLNYFSKQVLDSDIARRLGYSYENSSVSRIFHNVSDGGGKGNGKKGNDGNDILEFFLQGKGPTATLSQNATYVAPLPIP